jgi:pilus assembly protein CpaB
MSVRTALAWVLALAFGGSAAFGVNALTKKNSAADRPDTVSVVVAATNIPRFTTISPEMLKLSKVPRSLLPPGAFADPDEIVDRVADANFLKGEPLLDPKLSPKGAGRGAAAVIPPGMRAVTIKANTAAHGVAGFILPGNRVDVMLTTRDNLGDATGGGSTSTIVQNVEILAVNQRVEAPSENKVSVKELSSVTLLVTPEQAAKIDLGQNLGTLHLTLRNPLDNMPVVNAAATLRDLRLQAKVPLGQQLKEIFAAASKLMASRPPAPKAEMPEPITTEPPPPPLMIRTLRGVVPSKVPLQ